MTSLPGDLRKLAAAIEGDRLPEDAAVELVQAVTAATRAIQPGPKPGERGKQAKRLAALLTQCAGVTVELSYQAERGHDGRSGMYTAVWTDGPADLRPIVHKLADQVPLLDVEQLRYDRGGTDRARLAALLAWLDEATADEVRDVARPRHCTYSGQTYSRLEGHADTAHGAHDYPEQADVDIDGVMPPDETGGRRRYIDRMGRAIASMASDDVTLYSWWPHPTAWTALGQRIVQHGWPATRRWLEERAAGIEQLGDELDELGARRKATAATGRN